MLVYISWILLILIPFRKLDIMHILSAYNVGTTACEQLAFAVRIVIKI